MKPAGQDAGRQVFTAFNAVLGRRQQIPLPLYFAPGEAGKNGNAGSICRPPADAVIGAGYLDEYRFAHLGKLPECHTVAQQKPHNRFQRMAAGCFYEVSSV